MSANSLSIRYAHAFYAWVKKEKVHTQVWQDIGTLLAAHEASPAFQGFLANPLDKPATKVSKLTKALGKKVHPATLTFLSFLITKKRESLLTPILRQVVSRYKEDRHIRTAYLTTARPISPTLRKEVVQHIQQLTSEESVELIEKIEETIIGGYVLKVDDQQLDMSLRTQLTSLQKHWEQSPLPNLNTPTA